VLVPGIALMQCWDSGCATVDVLIRRHAWHTASQGYAKDVDMAAGACPSLETDQLYLDSLVYLEEYVERLLRDTIRFEFNQSIHHFGA